MEYNTEREELRMPEYGRVIQSLVEYCKTLKTKEERTKMAYGLISVLANRNAHVKEDEDEHKLWDHLFILAGYELDVEAPFPMPSPEELYEKPKKLDYPSYDSEYKFYGKSIVQLIEHAIALPKGDKRDALVEVIANNMKKSYNVYNKEHVQDEVIFKHLKDMSQNRLDLTSIDALEQNKIYYSANNNHKGKNRGNQKRKRNYRNHKKN